NAVKDRGYTDPEDIKRATDAAQSAAHPDSRITTQNLNALLEHQFPGKGQPTTEAHITTATGRPAAETETTQPGTQATRAPGQVSVTDTAGRPVDMGGAIGQFFDEIKQRGYDTREDRQKATQLLQQAASQDVGTSVKNFNAILEKEFPDKTAGGTVRP